MTQNSLPWSPADRRPIRFGNYVAFGNYVMCAQRRIQACMAMPAATPALIDRVDPY